MRKRKKIERIKKPKTFEEYMEWQIQQGFIDEKGKPMKCHECGSKKTKDCNYDYLDYMMVEYSVKCKSCDKTIGHWAYGYWQV